MDGIATLGTQTVSYTAFDRPASVSEGGVTAAFTYNESSDRVKMAVTDGTDNLLTRYYIGGNYEYDIDGNSTVTQRLYLEGDAYSAPVVYVKEGTGSWTLYNIARDYQGSIMAIADASGTAVASYSYDPWGRMRNPSNNAIYTPGNEPALFLGRGYTGHEHLPWFGLINMNARLYDPLVGRFLSADPYVQAPDFTQAFNRYSYALNNPLKYIDKDGEVAWFIPLLIGATIGGYSGYQIGKSHGLSGGDLLGYTALGAAIGGLSGGASVGVSAFGGSAWMAGMASGAVGGTGFSGLASNWTGEAMFKGAGIGAVSGLVGGYVGSAIGGGWGALAGGATSSGINTALNGGRPKQIGKSMLIGGALSYGSYEFTSLVGWYSSGKKLGTVDISYKQFKTMQADFQRSRLYQKEYGGFLMNDGSVHSFPSDWRHDYGIAPRDGSNISIPENAKAMYHTHWDVAGKSVLVDTYGNDVSLLAKSGLLTSIDGVEQVTTVLDHSEYDFIPIDSYVINRFHTSFNLGGNVGTSIIKDSFIRFFLWYTMMIK